MFNVDKTSPDFRDCETFINLGFSGLVAYWKPQTMLNLLEFLNDNKPTPKQKDGDNKLDIALNE
jgi:hypothetical protein